MPPHGDSNKNRKRKSNKRGDDKEGLDQDAINPALEIEPTPTKARRYKNMLSVVDSESLKRPAVDGPSKRRGRSRVVKKRTIGQVIPNTSGPMRTRLKGGSRASDQRNTYTVTRNLEYNEEKDVQSTPPAILNFPTTKDADVYNMNFKKRGLCVIFNQQEFNPGNGDFRKGSEIDVESIQRTFGNLGFTVKEHLNLTFSKVVEVITNLSNLDYSECDCLCVFVLTHGEQNGRVFARDASYTLLNLWTPFSTDTVAGSTLAGKPKLFFIQACKGGKLGEAVEGKYVTDNSEDTHTLPTNADFLFGYSTMEDYCSWRIEQKGSWYIQSLCDVIDKHWRDTDLLKMLTLTARKVAQDYSSRHEDKNWNDKKQMPSLMSTLTRDLYFTPKIEYQ